MYDIIIIGSGIAGLSFAYKASNFADVLLIDKIKDIDSFPEKVNLFIEHNRPFVEDLPIDFNNKEIFPRIHDCLNLMSEKKDGIIYASEFGEPFGYMMNTNNFQKELAIKFEQNGGFSLFNNRVKKILRHPDYIEIITENDTYKGKMVALATGSHAFELQKSLGFETPDRYMGVYANLYDEKGIIDENLKTTYTFHINTKISKSGPFFFNKGFDKITTGYLGDYYMSDVEIIEKLKRVLKNYKRIQPFIKDLKVKEEPKVVAISKHPIKHFSQDRALILGEAAGLVTAFFYEGIVCGFCCADVAAKTIKPLLEKESNFKREDLMNYDNEIKRILLSAFFKNGDASEYMFYSAPSAMKILWETYIELINTNKTLRRYIYDVHILQDLSKYDTKRDRWAGERIFAKLPITSKISLGPKFFRALFKL